MCLLRATSALLKYVPDTLSYGYVVLLPLMLVIVPSPVGRCIRLYLKEGNISMVLIYDAIWHCRI